MMQRRLKKPVLYAVYVVALLAVVGSIFMIESANNKSFKDDDNQKYVDKTIFEEDVPVVGTSKIIIRPYIDTEIKIVKNYYDWNDEKEVQQNSLIVHDNTYLQNSGVAYGNKGAFDVIAILEGTVISVKESDLLGKIVEIRHSNDVISVYQSLGEVKVKENDTIAQGTVIGKAGTCNISKDLNEHLNFELIIRGNNVNPENFYEKNINEI